MQIYRIISLILVIIGLFLFLLFGILEALYADGYLETDIAPLIIGIISITLIGVGLCLPMIGEINLMMV